MKKLLCGLLALLLVLSGCAGRAGGSGEETANENEIRPLELTEEESALLDLIGGTEAEYGLYDCVTGETVTGYTVEVLSWEDGAWQTVTEGGLSSSQSGTLRVGIVLSQDRITVNFQDGGAQYSYAPRLEDGMDRTTDPGEGRSWVWLEEAAALTPGERVPLYLEVYDSGDGVRSATLPDTFSDAEHLNSYDRAYAVAITVEAD